MYEVEEPDYKTEQEDLLEQLANALNRFDYINVNLSTLFSVGFGVIWFTVKKMADLDKLCKIIHPALIIMTFSLNYEWNNSKQGVREFALRVKCPKPSLFKEHVEEMIRLINNATADSNVEWVDFKNKRRG